MALVVNLVDETLTVEVTSASEDRAAAAASAIAAAQSAQAAEQAVEGFDDAVTAALDDIATARQGALDDVGQAGADAVDAITPLVGQAEAARDAAQTAQGGAEAARDVALAAQGGAEQARDEAEAAAAAAASGDLSGAPAILPPRHTFATIPAPGSVAYGAHAVLEEDGIGPVWNDGTYWRRYHDRSIAAPSWVLETAGGVVAELYCDFANQRYWHRGVAYFGFEDFLAGIGGSYARTGTRAYRNAMGGISYAAANLPAFPHDASGDPLGIRMSRAVTNIILRSEEFDDNQWGKTGLTVSADLIASPDGASTADKIVEDSGAGNHRINSGVDVSGATTYTVSVFARAAELRYLGIGGMGMINENVFPQFDLLAGTDETIGSHAGLLGHGIEAFADGWYRCWVTWTTTATGGPSFLTLANLAALPVPTNPDSRQGDGVSGLHLWGAGLTQTTYLTDYVQTQASTATIGVDDLVLGPREISGELMANPDFVADLSGWTIELNGGTGSVVWEPNNDGTAVLTGDGTNGAELRQSFDTTPGALHRVTLVTGSSAPTVLRIGTTVGGSEIFSASFNGAGTTHIVRFRATGALTHASLVRVPDVSSRVRFAGIEEIEAFAGYDSASGVLFAEASRDEVDAARGVLSVDDGTSNNRITLRSGTATGLLVTDVGVNLVNANVAGNDAVAVERRKMAAKYRADDFRAVDEGGAAVTDTSGTVPQLVSQMLVGSYPGSVTFPIIGYIQQIAYFPGNIPAPDVDALVAS